VLPNRLLTPDHGYPLRLLALGIAGGRQVKRLGHITISDSPTANKHHINENRRFPESLDRWAMRRAPYCTIMHCCGKIIQFWQRRHG
jgi:DMSO/TMAO reductase YedYZ molybdopterin-dependent catalytic subunit